MIADTTFIIDFMREEENAVLKSEEMDVRKEKLYITAISLFELHTGRMGSHWPDKEKTRILAAIKNQTILPLDEDAAMRAGEIYGELRVKGTPIGALDCLIAGIAKTKMEGIITRNVKDFKKVHGLLVETY